MKTCFTILVFFIAMSISSAQLIGVVCKTSISQNEFLSIKKTISALTTDELKLEKAIALLKAKCLLSSQIKELTLLFRQDSKKLDFCVTAYESAFDKQNFYEVYDAFSTFSNVLRLHDYVLYVQQQKPVNEENNNNVQPKKDELVFPPYSYPSEYGYMGERGCQTPISEPDFMKIAIQISKESNDLNKLAVIKKYLPANCFSTAQIMKTASLISAESNRLVFLKESFKNTFDKNNYMAADQLFTYLPYKTDFANFIGSQTTTVIINNDDPILNCQVNADDFNKIKASIEKESFDNSKIVKAKQIMADKKCFTTGQIIEIMNMFSFEDSKYEVATYCYDYCKNKDDYYQIADNFTFSMTKDDFMGFLKNKKK